MYLVKIDRAILFVSDSAQETRAFLKGYITYTLDWLQVYKYDKGDQSGKQPDVFSAVRFVNM